MLTFLTQLLAACNKLILLLISRFGSKGILGYTVVTKNSYWIPDSGFE